MSLKPREEDKQIYVKVKSRFNINKIINITVILYNLLKIKSQLLQLLYKFILYREIIIIFFIYNNLNYRILYNL